MSAPQFSSSQPYRSANAAIPEMSAGAQARARKFRPPAGIPTREERGLKGWVVSTLIHALIIALLLLPSFLHNANDDPLALGAGGPGARGGGGGGNRGTGGQHLEFIQVAPAPAPAQVAVAAPVVPPPVATPVVKPVIPPPPPLPAPVTTQPVAPATSTQVAAAPTPGANGGTGNDGTAGTGPGTGGGTGTGTGTGTGSDVGPGTGGGDGKLFPCVTRNFDVPWSVLAKLHHVVITVDVNELGQTLGIDVHTGNHGIDNEMKGYAKNWTFKPASKPDGTPVRARCQVTLG